MGRELFLNPSPDAATIAGTGPTMRLRYIAAPTRLGRGEVAGLSNLDQTIAQYLTAVHWCMSHRSAENEARKQDYLAWLTEQMPLARKRAQNMIEGFYPSWRPLTGRTGGAR